MSAGVAYLITRSPEARGVLDTATETARKVYCTEKSVSMTEIYQARAEGFAPEIRLKLTQRFEWKGEDVCLYKGTRYNIIRPYSDEKADGAELTLERIRGNAAAPVPEPDPNEGDPSPSAQDDTQGTDGNGQENTEGAAQGGSEGSGAPVGQSPEGDSDPNESAETSGENANSGEAATIEDAEEQNEPALAEGGEP